MIIRDDEGSSIVIDGGLLDESGARLILAVDDPDLPEEAIVALTVGQCRRLIRRLRRFIVETKEQEASN